MLLPVYTQIRLVFFSLIAGIITGILFDVYRLIRGFNNPNKLITIIEDILFWIFNSILIFLFLLYTDFAYVSIYIYFIIFFGIMIYIKLFSKAVIIFLSGFTRSVYKAFRIIGKTIAFPIHFIVYKIGKRNNSK